MSPVFATALDRAAAWAAITDVAVAVAVGGAALALVACAFAWIVRFVRNRPRRAAVAATAGGPAAAPVVPAGLSLAEAAVVLDRTERAVAAIVLGEAVAGRVRLVLTDVGDSELERVADAQPTDPDARRVLDVLLPPSIGRRSFHTVDDGVREGFVALMLTVERRLVDRGLRAEKGARPSRVAWYAGLVGFAATLVAASLTDGDAGALPSMIPMIVVAFAAVVGISLSNRGVVRLSGRGLAFRAELDGVEASLRSALAGGRVDAALLPWAVLCKLEEEWGNAIAAEWAARGGVPPWWAVEFADEPRTLGTAVHDAAEIAAVNWSGVPVESSRARTRGSGVSASFSLR
ncbi:DUF2207 domain-containing protein [Agromyces protaetiae]|uniref:DUF2207 domain-containing protein n=1 Tax=Agromyces protaetiae TaxID=2509455 RepID=A0A4P6FEP6_9MICO|nr:DUF2207 domain-containing protein [Agromyces protaetiae]QAY74395.1 DUF2207 domain-containing protein [Agromyces protaetiae]